LRTSSKLFSGAANAFGEVPNTAVGEVDVGLPGALPSLNRRAVDLAVAAGLAFGCEIDRRSRFDRKHYFYPDLPKGYQITQQERPLCRNGGLELEPEDAPGDTSVERRTIGIERLHLEEDAGKSRHLEADAQAGQTGRRLVDLNRSGVPLIEIVSRPELRTPAEAAAYLKELRRTVVQLGISDGEMAEGSMRCDANVSVAPTSNSGADDEAALGARVELKNINSFKFVKDGLTYEVGRQVRALERGDHVAEETRGYDPGDGETYRMRAKETDADYRYIADPDLPTLRVSDERIDRVESGMPTSPAVRRASFRARAGLDGYQAAVLSDVRSVGEYAGRCFAEVDAWAEGASDDLEGLVSAVGNWIAQDVMRVVDPPEDEGGEWLARRVMPPDDLVRLVQMREIGEISDNAAREVFDVIAEQPAGDKQSPGSVVDERDLRQLSDRDALAEVVDQVLEDNEQQAEQLRDGNGDLIGWFIGQVMQASGGRADPQVVREMLQAEM
jgi:aspartyl-tRNA(Asn)/glutamyl-tRNA(Gln) amidotransferase subunit B